MNLVLKLAGILLLLVIAAFGGYLLGSKNCLSQDTKLPASALTPTPTKTPSTPTPAPAKQPETELVFSNYNSAGVASSPTSPTIFTLPSARNIYLIQDYHWNSAKGKTPGTIALKSTEGDQFGPWPAKGDPGQGGVPNAYWTVYPDIEIPAGTYTIVDSDPASWAQNSGSKGLGMSQVYAVK